MRALFLQAFFILLVFSNVAISQEKKGEIEVSKTTDLKEVLKSETQYVEPEFVEGMVYYNSGKGSKGLMNYHLLNDEIHFISPDKKVLALTTSDINFVSLKNRVFIHNPNLGFLEVTYNGTIKLLVRRRVQVKEKEEVHTGAYGEQSQSATVQNAALTDGRVVLYDPTNPVKAEVLYTEEYYLGVNQKVIKIKNVKSIEKVVGKNNKQALHDYMAKENININISYDLQKLTKWINTLKE